MNEPRRIGEARSYDELLDALRARAVELNATRQALDEVAGLPKGYSAKVLAHEGPKGLGRISMGPLLNALGLVLIIAEDETSKKRYENRVGGGRRSYMLNGVKNKPVILRFSRRYMIELGKKSGAKRRKSIPKRTRSRIARQAAKARWNKPNIAELPPDEAARILAIEAEKYRRFRAKQRMGKFKNRGALPEF